MIKIIIRANNAIKKINRSTALKITVAISYDPKLNSWKAMQAFQTWVGLRVQATVAKN